MRQPASRHAPRDAIHTGFMRHRDFRWAKAALVLCAICIAAYVWHTPRDVPNGGTWLGYTLGGLAAALILFLTGLGVRKRRYRSRFGTLKGWTSAHVYLGFALIVIATLHTGFQFGLNVHTLTYGLMWLVVASGIYGLIVYAKLPLEIARLRDGSTREKWIDTLLDLNAQALKLAEPLGSDVQAKMRRSNDKVRIGGGLRQQLYGHKAASSAEDSRALLQQRIEALLQAPSAQEKTSMLQQSTVMFMAGQLGEVDRSDAELRTLQQLLALIGQRNALAARINRDIALHARLQVWLLLHVPLTFALLAALIAHIVSVFFYW